MNRLKSTLLILLSILMVFSLVISGCGKKDEKVEETPNEDENSVVVELPEPEFVYTAPLTGIGTNNPLPERLVAVMIENSAAARPQSGLQEADVVYEILAEGMITRFIAIFHSQSPDTFGPVRSIRPYFIELANGLDAIIVHAGSSIHAHFILTKGDQPYLDETTNAGAYFTRVDFRQRPHNVYTNLERIWQGAKDKKYRLEGEFPKLQFLAEGEEVAGTSANQVTITYSSSNYVVGYQYDATSESYRRLVNGEAHVDKETNQPLTTKNLLVIEAPHQMIANDEAGRREVELDGPGQGYLFQQGKMQAITWERTDKKMIRAFINGEEVKYVPGNTWVLVIPTVPGLAKSVVVE